jgi:predicted RNase H-like HicB family nuclease
MRWTNRLWRDLIPETSLTVTIHENDGMLRAEVQQLPECCVSGSSMDELQRSLAEAISLHFADPANGGRAGVRFWQKVGEVGGATSDHEHKIDVLVSPANS